MHLRLIALLVFVALSGSVSAGDTPSVEVGRQVADTVLVSMARRNNVQGVVQQSSASPITEAMVPSGEESLQLIADLAPADRVDPTKSFWLRVYVSRNDGATWEMAGNSLRFTGEVGLPASAIIGVSFPAAPFIGTRVRLELDAPSRVSLGGTVTVTATPIV
jgi:hypothetical protein